MSLAAGTKLGPYEILALIGAGGMGEVYRARDTRLGRDIALKILPDRLANNPDRRARFETEARAASALNHPGIITIHDIGNADGFVAECRQGVEFGFDGKTLIHPNQIEPCNAAFSPSAEEVAQARKMIAVFELPENKGKGVVSIDGRMVERLHAEMARRTVAIAEAIGVK